MENLRLIERTLYPPIVEYLNSIGFDSIGEAGAGRGASDIVFDLDVTSPLRTSSDLKNAYKIFMKEDSNNLITATPANKNPYFNQIQFKKNKYDIVIRKKNIPKRRQDAPKIYDMNASIYIWNRKTLINSESAIGVLKRGVKNKTVFYEMPESRSIDIDSELDFKLVEFLLKRKKLV